MAEITIDSFMTDVETISDRLQDNPLYTDAKNTITEQLDNVEISTEEKDKLLSSFLQNFSLPAITLAFENAAKIPLLNIEQQKAEAEKDKALYDKLQSLASLKKQYGFKDATTETLGADSGDGLIDKQIEGFFKDQIYKGIKTFSEQSAMLANNDITTPPWMVDYMKIGAEMLSSGKINIKVEEVSGEEVTTVNYDGDATEANGLDA